MNILVYFSQWQIIFVCWVLLLVTIKIRLCCNVCGAGNAYPSGAHDFASGFDRGSCCPVICVSLFHVIVLSFGFWVLTVPFVWLLSIYNFYLQVDSKVTFHSELSICTGMACFPLKFTFQPIPDTTVRNICKKNMYTCDLKAANAETMDLQLGTCWDPCLAISSESSEILLNIAEHWENPVNHPDENNCMTNFWAPVFYI